MLRKQPNKPPGQSSGGGETYAEIEAQFSSSEKYELEWIELCIDMAQEPDLKELRRKGMQEGFKRSKFRSLCWALLLEVLKDDSSKWLTQRRIHRTKYAELKLECTHNPYKEALKQVGENGVIFPMAFSSTYNGERKDHPLSQSEQSLWHQHFCDQELAKLIRQDVTRAFPSVGFFRDPKIQDILASILFCYARVNSKICYRQGMHEILGPILFVIHQDHLQMLQIKHENKSINHTLHEILDPNFLEEDAYCLFSKIMAHMETYYRIQGVVPNASGELPPVQDNDIKRGRQTVPDELERHVNWMRHNVLRKHDPQLDEHLTKLQIPLSIVGIRYFRVLFGREFSFPDLLILWDAIFSDQFDLVNYIPAAMLISVRHLILTSDFVGVYQCLMNYKGVVDIRKIIKYSLFLKDELRYKKPEGIFVKVPARHVRKVQTIPPDKLSSLQSDNNRPRANSLQRFATKKTSASLAQMKTPSLDSKNHHELGIMDGYTEDDPAVLKLELQHMTNILDISRLKLKQYITILRDNRVGTKNPQVSQCLDGLEELTALMRTRGGSTSSAEVIPPLASVSPPVEPALEADELQDDSKLPGASYQTLPRQTRRNLTEQEVKSEFVRTLKRNCDKEEMPTSGVFEENPSESQTIIAVYPNSASEFAYEVPECAAPHLVLGGNRKEVEMKEIRLKAENKSNASQCCLPNPNPQRERSEDDS